MVVRNPSAAHQAKRRYELGKAFRLGAVAIREPLLRFSEVVLGAYRLRGGFMRSGLGGHKLTCLVGGFLGQFHPHCVNAVLNLGLC